MYTIHGSVIEMRRWVSYAIQALAGASEPPLRAVAGGFGGGGRGGKGGGRGGPNGPHLTKPPRGYSHPQAPYTWPGLQREAPKIDYDEWKQNLSAKD